MRAMAWSWILIPALLVTATKADDPGQKFFDQALEKRLQAESLRELTEVIDLAEQALEAGMTGPNKQFCENFLASTLIERAAQLSRPVLAGVPVDTQQLQQLIRFREMAQRDLERAVELTPRTAQGQFLLGRLQSLPGGDKEKALKALSASIDIADDEPGLRAKALVARAKVVDDPEKKRADLDAAVEAAPGDIDAREARATFLLRNNGAEKALEDIKAALELADEDEEPGLYELQGLTLATLKKYDEAEAAFAKTIEAVPGAASPYYYRARVRLLAGNAKGALEDVNKALTLITPQPEVLLLRAAANQQLGKTEDALKDVDSALKIDPDMPEAVRARATLLAGSGKLDEAIGDLEKLREGETQDTATLLQLGMLYYTNGNIRQAIDVFGSAIKQDPKQALAYQARADARLRTGDHAGARDDYEQALKIEPDNTHVLNNLAWLLATSPEDNLRNAKRAIELATKACELTEYKRAHILSTLAAGYAESGDFDAAIKWSKKALEVGKNDGQIGEQLEEELKSYQARKPWREKHSLEEE